MSLARRYATVQNNTASKERLTVLLFEAALKHMRTAAGHLGAKRRSEGEACSRLPCGAVGS